MHTPGADLPERPSFGLRIMKKLIALAAGLLTFAVAACGGGFDRTAWDAGKGNFSGKNPRLGMVSKAIAAGVKPGAKRDEVHGIIGLPDKVEDRTDAWYLGQNDMAPDYVTLVVRYDANDVVTTANVENS
jgi:hypothetical protein